MSEIVGDDLYLLCFIGCLSILPSINSCFCESVILIDLIALYIFVESLRDCPISSS